MELSEAAGLADHFVFRLLFRPYDLPEVPQAESPAERAAFFGRKRLIRAFAAKSWPLRSSQRGEGKTRYLVLSALALDGRTGSCPALVDNRCSIWSERPLTCRSVPLHYSIPDPAMIWRFDAFVATPGFACDTSADAPLLIADGALVDPAMTSARREAVGLATGETRWKQAIVAQMRPGQPYAESLPTREQIDQHAAAHALTVPMAVAWHIAAHAGLLKAEAVAGLLDRQLRCLDRELATECWDPAERRTLIEMRADYGGVQR